MRWRLSLISDTHAGSLVGLAPRQGIPHPDGLTISSSPTSSWLWRVFENHLDREAGEVEAGNFDRHALIFVGDIMDGGMHHGTTQLYHPDPAVESWIAQQIVERAVEVLRPDHIFVVLGTPAHVGKNGSREESVGKALAARYGDKLARPNDTRYGWHILRMDLDGTLVDIRHHGKLGQLPHTRESYQKRYAFDVWSSQAMYTAGVPAQLAIRAHRHKYVDSGPVPPHKRTTRLISMPCYQLGTEWVQRMAIEEPADIGMVGISVRDGRVSDVFPQVVFPKLQMEVATWTP